MGWENCWTVNWFLFSLVFHPPVVFLFLSPFSFFFSTSSLSLSLHHFYIRTFFPSTIFSILFFLYLLSLFLLSIFFLSFPCLFLSIYISPCFSSLSPQSSCHHLPFIQFFRYTKATETEPRGGGEKKIDCNENKSNVNKRKYERRVLLLFFHLGISFSPLPISYRGFVECHSLTWNHRFTFTPSLSLFLLLFFFSPSFSECPLLNLIACSFIEAKKESRKQS